MGTSRYDSHARNALDVRNGEKGQNTIPLSIMRRVQRTFKQDAMLRENEAFGSVFTVSFFWFFQAILMFFESEDTFNVNSPSFVGQMLILGPFLLLGFLALALLKMRWRWNPQNRRRVIHFVLNITWLLQMIILILSIFLFRSQSDLNRNITFFVLFLLFHLLVFVTTGGLNLIPTALICICFFIASILGYWRQIVVKGGHPLFAVIDVGSWQIGVFVLGFVFKIIRNRVRDKVVSTQTMVWTQKANTDAIVNNIMPPTVAKQLKSTSGTEFGVSFENATVMFVKIEASSDEIHIFEKFLTQMEDLYVAFDALAGKRGIYIAERLRDVYVCVAGAVDAAPFDHTNDHCSQIAMLASSFLRVCSSSSSSTSTSKSRLNIGIGIHTGQVAAAVVASDATTPHFTLVGETVNTAARLASTCEPNNIQVSTSFLEHLAKEYDITLGENDLKVVMEQTHTDKLKFDEFSILDIPGIGEKEGIIDLNVNVNAIVGQLIKLSCFIFKPHGIVNLKNIGDLRTWNLFRCAITENDGGDDINIDANANVDADIENANMDPSVIMSTSTYTSTNPGGIMNNSSSKILNRALTMSRTDSIDAFLSQLKQSLLFKMRFIDMEDGFQEWYSSRNSKSLRIIMGAFAIMYLFWILVLGDVFKDKPTWYFILFVSFVPSMMLITSLFNFLTLKPFWRRIGNLVLLGLLISFFTGQNQIFSSELYGQVMEGYGSVNGLLICTVFFLFARVGWPHNFIFASIIGVFMSTHIIFDEAGVEFVKTLQPLVVWLHVAMHGAYVEYIFELDSRRQFKSNIDAANEKKRSENVLRTILPAFAAERILGLPSNLDGPQILYHELTVIQVDIVGFTSMSKRLSPRHLSVLLNVTFSTFDRLMASSEGVVKLYTVGDALIACSGFTTSDNNRSMHGENEMRPRMLTSTSRHSASSYTDFEFDKRVSTSTEKEKEKEKEKASFSGQGGGNHAANVCRYALSLVESLDSVNKKLRDRGLSDADVSVRVGVATGLVVDGVNCAKQRPMYFLWGPAVEEAEELERTGMVNKVHVSSSTFEFAKRCAPISSPAKGGISRIVNKFRRSSLSITPPSTRHSRDSVQQFQSQRQNVSFDASHSHYVTSMTSQSMKSLGYGAARPRTASASALTSIPRRAKFFNPSPLVGKGLGKEKAPEHGESDGENGIQRSISGVSFQREVVARRRASIDDTMIVRHVSARSAPRLPADSHSSQSQAFAESSPHVPHLSYTPHTPETDNISTAGIQDSSADSPTASPYTGLEGEQGRAPSKLSLYSTNSAHSQSEEQTCTYYVKRVDSSSNVNDNSGFVIDDLCFVPEK